MKIKSEFTRSRVRPLEFTRMPLAGAAPPVGASATNASVASVPIPHEVVWGPISKEEADACGAPAPCSAVLLSPLRTATAVTVMESVMAAFPQDVLPLATDTQETLVARLAASSFLDDGLVRQGGNQSHFIRLNKTNYAQARTVSWAEGAPPGPVEWDEGGASQPFLLPFYRNPTRLTEDHAICSPWPAPVQALRDFCHQLAYPYLGPLSRANKQDHVEVKIYYTMFKSKIGKHRDNFTGDQLYQYFSTGTHPFDPASTAERAKRGQLQGSDFMIWTMGNAPMVWTVSFPRNRSRHCVRKTAEYVVHPTFQCEVGNGTLLVFPCFSDLFFAHSAEFSPVGLQVHPRDGYRLSFVFRNVEHKALFDQDTRVMVPGSKQ